MKGKFVTIVLSISMCLGLVGCTPAAYDGGYIEEKELNNSEPLEMVDIEEYISMGEVEDYLKGANLTTKKEDGTPYKIAWIANDETDEQVAYVTRCMKSFAEEYGIELICFDSQMDPQKQNNQIEQAIIQQCDGLIIVPIDAMAENLAMKKAREAGLVVVCSLMSSSDEDCYDIYVGADEILGARQAATMLINEKPEGGKIVVIQGVLGSSSQMYRDEGFERVIENYDQYEIIDKQTANWTSSEAMSLMEVYLAKYDDIVGVFCHNDVMGLGALQAIENAGRDDIAVVSIDRAQSAIDEVAEGSCIKGVSMLPILLTSEVQLMATISKLNGDKVDKNLCISNICVTKENAEGLDAGWGY